MDRADNKRKRTGVPAEVEIAFPRREAWLRLTTEPRPTWSAVRTRLRQVPVLPVVKSIKS